MAVPTLGPPVAVFLDGALLRDGDTAHAGYIAAFAAPWPGGAAFYRSPGDDGFAGEVAARAKEWADSANGEGRDADRSS